MARKGSLIGSMKTMADQVAAEPPGNAPTPKFSIGEMTTTAVHIPKATLSLLRRVAITRADSQGGRPSVSAVISDLVEKARSQLEQEFKD